MFKRSLWTVIPLSLLISYFLTAQGPKPGGSSGGSVGGSVWGAITGTLSSQSDLNTALAGKVPTTTTVAGHALSGNVSIACVDLTVPCVTSQGITLINEQVLGGTAATVTFSSIPQTYHNLRMVVVSRCDLAANFSDVYLQFNGDTGSNYTRQYIVGNNVSPSANQTVSAAKVGFLSSECSTGVTSYPATNTVDIPAYTGTTFFKTLLVASGMANGSSLSGNMFISATQGIWASTSAINAIVVGLTGSGNFIAGSVFDLYGY